MATRSAGQASTGYGRIDDLVEGVRLISPAGELVTRAVPASAAGPSLRELAVGSEGVLGVIGEATLRVRPAPEQRRYEGWSFRNFAEGADALRVMEQADASPDVARLSDEHETRMSFALASSGSRTERLGRALPASPRPRGRLPGDHGVGGRRRGGGAPPCALRGAAAGRRRPRAGLATGRGMAARGASRAPTCATT